MPKGPYVFSIWIKVDEDMGMTQEVKFLEISQTHGRKINFSQGILSANIQTIVNGWALFEVPFNVQEDNSNMEIYLHKKNANVPFWYDEVLIKDKNFHLYRRYPEWVIRDNYWFKLPKYWSIEN